jgi:general secretion pathway protein A
MVLNFYKLAEQPFGVTPDPRYLYLSPTHREALASALYGITVGRGFTALIAKPGMGKTTLLFHLLQKLQGSARTVFLFQTQSSPRDLLHSVLTDLGIEDDGGDIVQMQSKMNEALLHQSSLGKRFVVVIDEAQNLDESVLEVVRMLSNFETPREKLMQIVLAGQPELAKKLASPRLEQLRQRVSIVARLMPFDAAETRLYIEHRLRVAGYESPKPLFTDRAFAMIAKHAGGIPRNINNICFNAMSIGCVRKQETIDRDVIKEVLADLDLAPLFEDAPGAAAPRSSATPSAFTVRSTPSVFGSWPVKAAIVAAIVIAAALSWPSIRANWSAKASNDGKISMAAPAATVPSVAPSVAPSGPGASAPVVSGTSTATDVSPTAVVKETPVVRSPDGNAESKTVSSKLDSDDLRDTRLIPVAENDTLYSISMENYGRYDRQIVDRIRLMNPWLHDPDHIQTGQKLRIPIVQQNPNESNPAAPRAAEVTKQ